MKVIAAVMLIMVALFDLVAGFGFFGGGHVAHKTVQYGQEVSADFRGALDQVEEKMGGSQQPSSAQNTSAEGKAWRDDPQAWSIAGVALIMIAVIALSGAVYIFQNTNPVTVGVAGLAVIAGEAIGIYFTNGIGLFNYLGIIAGILTLLVVPTIGSRNTN